MFNKKDKELIDYFIEELKKRADFEIIASDNPNSSYYLRLLNMDQCWFIGIGYIDLCERVEIFSNDMLFEDIIILYSKKQIDRVIIEIIPSISKNGVYSDLFQQYAF